MSAAAREMIRERNAVMLDFLRPFRSLTGRTLLEAGAAEGANVPYYLQWGFHPKHIVLTDIDAAKMERARAWLPHEVRTLACDAAMMAMDETFDVVVAATLLSSVPRPKRPYVAHYLWRLVAPGGGVLLYDFTWDSPNPAVSKVTLAEIRRLFPHATMQYRRVTLAPPLQRHTPLWLGRLLHRCPWLRTHVVCWLANGH